MLYMDVSCPCIWCSEVLVHCASGVSRSSSLCMAHLMISEHWRLRSAARRVEESSDPCRKCIEKPRFSSFLHGFSSFFIEFGPFPP